MTTPKRLIDIVYRPDLWATTDQDKAIFRSQTEKIAERHSRRFGCLLNVMRGHEIISPVETQKKDGKP